MFRGNAYATTEAFCAKPQTVPVNASTQTATSIIAAQKDCATATIRNLKTSKAPNAPQTKYAKMARANAKAERVAATIHAPIRLMSKHAASKAIARAAKIAQNRGAYALPTATVIRAFAPTKAKSIAARRPIHTVSASIPKQTENSAAQQPRAATTPAKTARRRGKFAATMRTQTKRHAKRLAPKISSIAETTASI